MKKIFPLILNTLYLILTTALPVQAQIDLGTSFKLNETDSVSGTFPNVSTIISTLLPNIYILAGVILFFIAIGGGIKIISSGSDPEANAKGKQAITGAIIGFVIIFASFWIIQILEIITGINILNSTL